jgi:hypothetical protein
MICTKCSKDKDQDEFYKRRRGYDEFQSWCKKCLDSRTHERQLQNKAKAVALLGGKCIRCGYNKCISALEFHHVNPENKERVGTGNLASRCWERYLEEIKKCILLCANCHREEEESLRPRSAADSAVLS